MLFLLQLKDNVFLFLCTNPQSETSGEIAARRTPSGVPRQTFFHSPYQPFFLRRLHLDALRLAAGKLLRQRPVDMFVQHGVLAQARAQREHNAVLVGRIAQRHGDIAQPAQVADAAYC